MELLFSRPARAHGRLRVNFTHIGYGYTGNLVAFPGLPGLLLPFFSRTSTQYFVHGQVKESGPANAAAADVLGHSDAIGR